MNDEVDFWHADKHQRFLQIDTTMLGVCGQASKYTQNNKCSVSLQYLKKEVNDEVDFLHGDKHGNFLHIDPVINGTGTGDCSFNLQM